MYTDRGERKTRTELRGCCAKICANLIMSGSLFRVWARSTIWSAAFCWSQGPAAARRVVNAFTEMVLHWPAPPAASHAATHWVVESAIVCAIRLERGMPYAGVSAATRARTVTVGK